MAERDRRGLDPAAPARSDRIHGRCQGETGNALPAVLDIGEEAGDAPLRGGVTGKQKSVRLGRRSQREIGDQPELAPPDRFLTGVHEDAMTWPCHTRAFISERFCASRSSRRG